MYVCKIKKKIGARTVLGSFLPISRVIRTVVCMTMKSIIAYIIIFLLSLGAYKSYGQRSCVFLPELQTEGRVYDRPKPTLHRIHPFSIPAPQNLLNAAPDFPNINVSSYLLADQDETSIAINPTDPNNIIIGANDYRSFSALFHFESFDGGKTWAQAEMPSDWIFAAYASDPSVAFNSSGKAFYSYGRGESPAHPINDVVCFTSTNGGTDWSNSVRIIFDSTDFKSSAVLADKFYIAVDKVPGSPYKDRAYESWVEYSDANVNRIRFAFSSDGGSTWSKPSFITTSGNYQSPIPAVGVDGNVYLTYENIDPAIREIHFAESFDGGKTFPLDKKISNYTELGPILPAGDPAAHPTIKGGLRVNSFPSIAVDYSSAHHGRIYMTWAAMGSNNRHHIYLTFSDNSGNNWSVPKIIENDPSSIATDKFFPWIAVDDITGDLGVVCYDSRSDTANILTDLYMYFSRDGGQNFAPERISGNSSDVKVSHSGFDPFFFGDYIGVAAHNKLWHPAWADSRVGYDQDIYTSIVRPYAPSAARNFIAIEDSISHLPDLVWEHTPVTTFGAALSDYVFRLKRLDGGLQIDLPKSVRSYNDTKAVKNTNYVYTLQVITPQGDTSVTQTVHFTPRANNESLPPIITSAKALPNSLEIFFGVPDKNVAGTDVQKLNKIYFLVNGGVVDSFLVGDDSRGKQKNYTFYNLHPDGYYRIQLAASTKQSDNDTTLSILSPARWLYCGMPLTSYSENFEGSKDIFTPFAWDTTRAGGKLPSSFINDSLPDVPYQKGTDSWFVLPPVTINTEAHTLEYTHIALVTQGDSAIVEVSTNDGVDYFPIAAYDITDHPADWKSSLDMSKPVHEILGLKYLAGKDAIVRFRLRTHSSDGDGWFIDSINFTNTLAVSSQNTTTGFQASLSSNPIRIGSSAAMKIHSDKPVTLTVNIYSVLGKKQNSIIENKPISSGDFELNFSPDRAGCYVYEIIARSERGVERRYGKYIVLP